MKTLFTLALGLLLSTWQPQAFALSCGDTVSADITLTADMHCTTGWVALYAPTSGVTIRLNGHTLSGLPGLQGIQVLNATHVKVLGPGRISGFWAGVNATRADYITVQDVDFDAMDAGFIASDTLAATVQNNHFKNLQGWGVYIIGYPGSRTTLGAHAIIGNQVLESIGGISICGHANSDNLIKDNLLQGIVDYGIHLYDASNHNQVLNNQLRKTGVAGVVLRGSRDNRIRGNLIDYGNTGMALIPQFTGSCSTGPYIEAEVRDNLIEGNSVFKHTTGLSLGLGGKEPLVLKNRIKGNKLYYDGTGIYLQTDTYANDATGNVYTGTLTPVTDLGSGNSY